jgi:hypothetical protein
MTQTDPRPRTVDRLRHDIDRGLTGDKAPNSDPAAAPLGADAEAGGAPPTPQEIDLEAQSRTIRPHGDRPRRQGLLWLAGAFILLVLAFALVQAG